MLICIAPCKRSSMESTWPQREFSISEEGSHARATGLQIPLMNNSTPIIGDSVTYVPLFHPFSVELSFSIPLTMLRLRSPSLVRLRPGPDGPILLLTTSVVRPPSTDRAESPLTPNETPG